MLQCASLRAFLHADRYRDDIEANVASGGVRMAYTCGGSHRQAHFRCQPLRVVIAATDSRLTLALYARIRLAFSGAGTSPMIPIT